MIRYWKFIIILSLILVGCSNRGTFSSASSEKLTQPIVGTVLDIDKVFVDPNSRTQGEMKKCSIVNVDLIPLNTDDTSLPAVASTNVSTDGSFRFDGPAAINILDLESSSYILRAHGCGKFVERPLTAKNGQSISYASSLISLHRLAGGSDRRLLSSLSKGEVEDLLENLISVNGSISLPASLEMLLATESLKEKYHSVMLDDPENLRTLVGAIAPLVSIANNNVFWGSSSRTLSFAAQSGGFSIDRFECSIDFSSFSSCISPMTYSGLNQGQHSLRVRAVDSYGLTSDVTTASWRVDLTAPIGSITGSPAVNSNAAVVQMSFSFSDENPELPALSCKLDSAEWSVCTSPVFLSVLSGRHTFSVRAADVSGNVSIPVSYSWTTDLIPPKLSISAPPAGTSASEGLTISGQCESGLTVAASGSGLSSPSTAPCENSTFNLPIVFSDGQGSKEISIYQIDLAGNETSVGIALNRSGASPSAPNLTIASPTAGTSFQVGATLSGQCENGLPISISGPGVKNTGTANCVAGSYLITVAFTDGDGAKQISLTQSSLTGLSTTKNLSLNRDESVWKNSGRLRYAPPTLVNPIEVGVASVAGRPGTGIYAAKVTASWSGADFSPDSRQDVLIRGSEISSGQTENRVFNNGRRWAIIGGDFTPAARKSAKINPANFMDEFYIEGIRLDYTAGMENDAIFIRQDADLSRAPNVTIQRAHIKGMHGTNKVHGSEVAIISVSATGLVTTAAPHGLTANSGNVIIGDTISSPVDVHNWMWSVGATPTATTFYILPNDGKSVPAIPSTGGRMWSSGSTSGRHSDAVQVDDNSSIGTVRLDSVTLETSYDTLILGRRNGTNGNLATRLSRVNARRRPINPHDNRNINLYLGDTDQSMGVNSNNLGRRADVDFQDVYVQPWAGGNGLDAEDQFTLVYPGPNTTFNGTPVGSYADTVNGLPVLRWAQGSQNIKINGYVNVGSPVSDFAQWGTPGNDIPGKEYINTVGYSEQLPAVPISDISISNLSTSETLAAGGSIGWIDVSYPIRGYIIDVTLQDNLNNSLTMRGAELVRGANPLSAGSYQINFIARINRDVAGREVAPEITFTKSFNLVVAPSVRYIESIAGNIAGLSNSIFDRTLTFSGSNLATYKAIVLKNQSDCSSADFSNIAEVQTSIPFTLRPSGDGSYIVCIIGKSLSGLWQTVPTASGILNIDTTAPILAISLPSANLPYGTSSINLSGTCESGLDVMVQGTGVNSVSSASCISGSFYVSIPLSFSSGSKDIIISQTDLAGNVGTTSRTYSFVSRPTSTNNIFASFGDSRLANYSDVTGQTPGYTKIVGIQEWAIRLSGGKLRFPTALNFSNTGDSTSAAANRPLGMVERIQNAINDPSQPLANVGNALLLCGSSNWGLNRASGGVFTASASLADMRQAISLLRARGIIVFIIAELPRGTDVYANSILTDSSLTSQLDYRAGLLQLHDPDGGVYVIGAPWDKMVDNVSSATIKSDFTSDGLNLNWQGAYWTGKSIAEIASPVVPNSFLLPSTNSDTYDATTNPQGNLITNPLMTANAGSTTAAGFVVTATSGIVVNTSLVTVSGETWQQVTYSGATSSSATSGTVTVYQNLPVTAINGGDQIDLAVAAQLDVGPIGIGAIYGDLRISYQDIDNVTQSYIPIAGDRSRLPDVTPSERQDMVIRLEKVKMPAIYNNGHPTSARAEVVVRVQGGGAIVSGSFRVRAMSVVKNRSGD